MKKMAKAVTTMKIPFDCDAVRVTSIFGLRVINGFSEKHKGFDMVGVGSNVIVSVCDGKVIHSRIITDKNNPTWEWGNYVCIKGNDGRYYYYCHMHSRLVKAGDVVNAGDKIGIMGNTGRSYGAHLHFEVREKDAKTPINPEFVLGIKNELGRYEKPSQLENDLTVMQKAEIINTPTYWAETAIKVQYLPELIHKMANYVKRNGG